MNTENRKELSVTCPVETINGTKSINDSKITDIINKAKTEIVNTSVEVIKTNMVKTVDGILDVFESDELDNRCFFVDEIEVALNISREGSVSILSTISSQANVQSSVVIKFKRRTNTDG